LLEDDPVAAGEPSFSLKTPWGTVPLALPGERAAECASLALAAFRALGYDPSGRLGALASAQWPGRMERFPSPCPRGCVYISGDHNAQGARSLAQLLRHWRYREARLVVGIGQNKNAREIIDELERIPRARLSFTRVPFRGAERSAYERPGAPYDDDPLRALERAEREAEPGDLIVVTGSLYLVGAVRRALMERANSGAKVPRGGESALGAQGLPLKQ
jgi:dihydrofolate synthase/folylpolyglutamate synthase